MFTHINSSFSEISKNFISPNIFSGLSKENNKIAIVALTIFSTIAILFIISRCFTCYKNYFAPISTPILPIEQTKNKLILNHQPSTKEESPSSHFSPKNHDQSPDKKTQPELSDEEYARLLAQQFADEVNEDDDYEYALKLQQEFDKMSQAELSDEQHPQLLAQQFAKEDDINFESVLQMQQKFHKKEKNVNQVPFPRHSQNDFTKDLFNHVNIGENDNTFPSFAIKQDITGQPVQKPAALVPLFQDSVSKPVTTTVVSIFKIEDVWKEITDNPCINSSFSQKIDPAIHLEIDNLFNDLITKWENHFSISDKAKRGEKVSGSGNYQFMLGMYNLYLYGPSIIDNLTEIKKRKNQYNYSDLMQTHCVEPLEKMAGAYIERNDADQVILTAVRLSYMLAEVADLAKKSKDEELRDKFYLDLFKNGLPAYGCFKAKTNHLVGFCIKWKNAFTTPPSETEARTKLKNGDFGITLKDMNHETLINNPLTRQQLNQHISELDLEKNGRPLDKWLEEEQGKIIDYLKEKGIWKNVLYHKEAGETYFLFDEKSLEAFLKEFYVSLIW